MGTLGATYNHPENNCAACNPSCTDTPNWSNGHGYSCTDYESKGWCCGQGACPGQEWTLGATYNHPENNCLPVIRRAPTLPTGPTGTDTVARITRVKVGAAAKVPAPDRNGRSAQLTTTPRTTAVLAHRGRDHLEYVWPRLSLWRLSIPQPAICVRRPPNEQPQAHC